MVLEITTLVAMMREYFYAIILLFGVNIFGYIMGIFMGLVDKYQTLNQELDDGDRLTLFFGLIRFYNNKIPLD